MRRELHSKFIALCCFGLVLWRLLFFLKINFKKIYILLNILNIKYFI